MVIPEGFQHILRVLGTNIDGKQKVMFALTAIKVKYKSYVALFRVSVKDITVFLFNPHHRALGAGTLILCARRLM